MSSSIFTDPDFPLILLSPSLRIFLFHLLYSMTVGDIIYYFLLLLFSSENVLPLYHSWWFFFFPWKEFWVVISLKMRFLCLLISLDSDDKSMAVWFIYPLYAMCHFSKADFNLFSSTLLLIILTRVCLGVIFFVFILFGVYWISWIYKFMFVNIFDSF